MSEWKGLCRCIKCGDLVRVGHEYEPTEESLNHPDNLRRHIEFNRCEEGARYVLHERRAPDPEKAELVAALRKILGWREWHDHLPKRTAEAVIEFMEETASVALRRYEETKDES